MGSYSSSEARASDRLSLNSSLQRQCEDIGGRRRKKKKKAKRGKQGPCWSGYVRDKNRKAGTSKSCVRR